MNLGVMCYILYFSCFLCFFLRVLIYLKEKATEGERELFPSAGLIPKCPQHLGLGQTEATWVIGAASQAHEWAARSEVIE